MMEDIHCPHCGREIEMGRCDKCGVESPLYELTSCDGCYLYFCEDHLPQPAHECEHEKADPSP